MRNLSLVLAASLVALMTALSAEAAGEGVWTFELGQKLPCRDLQSLDGAPTGLDFEADGPMLINIFATWCAPCRMEIPQIETKLWQRYRDAGLRVIGVARGQPAEVVRPFVRSLGVTYPVHLDPGWKFFNCLAADGKGIPKSLLVDGTGRVVWRENGYFPGETIPDLDTRIRRLLDLAEEDGN